MRILNVGDIFAFDVDDVHLDEARRQFDVKVMANLEDALDLKPDVALITTPNSSHVPLALQSACQGCHLFVEKPLSDRLEGVDQLLNLVNKKNLVTLVGCNMRFHPGLLMVKKLVEDGTIGSVVAVRAEGGQYLPDWHPWEDYRRGYSARIDLGGGIILDGIHELDYARWMFGEIETVACFAGKMTHLEIETEDTAAILLRFANGTIGEIHLDYVQRVYSRTCHIIGDQGTIRWDYTTGEIHWYTAENRQWHMFTNPFGWKPNQMYLEEMRHFLKCLAGEEKPFFDVFEAKKVLEVALAAKASAASGQIIRLNGETCH